MSNDETTRLDEPAERIQKIVEVAEAAAEGIVKDAEAQAARFLDDWRRRVDQMAEERLRSVTTASDALVRHAETLMRRSDELMGALDQARQHLSEHEEEAGMPRDPSEGARILASQMAVAGSTRDQIVARLRDDFGIDDPGPYLDDIGGRK